MKIKKTLLTHKLMKIQLTLKLMGKTQLFLKIIMKIQLILKLMIILLILIIKNQNKKISPKLPLKEILKKKKQEK